MTSPFIAGLRLEQEDSYPPGDRGFSASLKSPWSASHHWGSLDSKVVLVVKAVVLDHCVRLDRGYELGKKSHEKERIRFRASAGPFQRIREIVVLQAASERTTEVTREADALECGQKSPTYQQQQGKGMTLGQKNRGKTSTRKVEKSPTSSALNFCCRQWLWASDQGLMWPPASENWGGKKTQTKRAVEATEH